MEFQLLRKAPFRMEFDTKMPTYKGITAALGITLLLKLGTVLPALILADIIDKLSDSATTPYTLLAFFFVLIAVQALLTPLQSWALAKATQKLVRRLSLDWCNTLMEKRFEAYSRLHGGGLVKVLDRGITAQERWLAFLIS